MPGGNKAACRPGPQQRRVSTQVVLPTETDRSGQCPLGKLTSVCVVETGAPGAYPSWEDQKDLGSGVSSATV